MIKKILLLGLFLPIFNTVQSQNLNTWNVFPSFSTVQSIAVDDEKIYSATLGGIYLVEDQEIGQIITTMEGLHRSDPMNIIFDDSHNQLFAGYIDGMIDVINPETNEVQRLEDINRITRFNSKSINAFKIQGQDLFVATSFGIVIYDLESLLVRDSYVKFGGFNIGIPVNDLDISEDSIFVATTQGIAAGSLNDNLVESSNWQTFTQADGLPSDIIHDVVKFNANLYAIVEGELYYKQNAGWETHPTFPSDGYTGLVKNYNGNSIGVSSDAEIKILFQDGNTEIVQPTMESTINTVVLRNNEVLVGSSNEGLLYYEDVNENAQNYLPTGPYLNFFGNTIMDEGTLIAASSTEFPGTDPFNPIRGYYIYNNGTWDNYNRNTRDELAGTHNAFSLGQTETDYYVGSWGYGIFKHSKENDEIVRYHQGNSNLEGIASDPNYVVVSGLDSDLQQNMWAVSYLSEFPLNVQLKGTDNWIPFEPLSGSDNYYKLFIDSFDHKWISLISSSSAGLGLLIVDTGNPEDPSDDKSVKLTSNPNNGNLPDDKVNVMLQDHNEEVWIGTNRGIARFIFPEFIVDGGPQERQAQWLISDDTAAVSRFLLRDVDVTSMAVNAANEKWIGSRNQGIWVLNAEGSRIMKRYTAENSQLISDNILSISVNNENGEVFISTDLGLVSYQDIPQKPVNKMDELKVYPNPFQYDRHYEIVIDGLSESTNIKILGVDGFVVNQLESQGGRISWDGYDYNGNKLGSGVYYIVAYEESGKERGIGKVVIIK